MKNLKVAYILHRFPILSETFVLDEILEIEKKELDVSVFSFERSPHTIMHREAEKLKGGIFYTLNPKDSLKSLLRVLKANINFLWRSPREYLSAVFKYAFKMGKKEFLQVFYLGDLIEKQNPQHLHAHFACLGTTAAMLISRFLHIPFSFTVHAHDIFVENDFLEEKLKQARYVIAISNYNKEYLLRQYPDIPPDKIKVIHCGINTEIFKPRPKIPEESIRLLSGGRFVEKKGFTYLIRACNLLADKGIKFRCDVFGDGLLKKDLSYEVRQLGLEERIHFYGAVSREDLTQLLAESDIFVLPSIIAKDGDRDGIPVTLMEAMSSGKAVVSTDISGIPELISSGEDGILISQKSEVKLAEAIENLIKDNELREQLGIKAREKVEAKFNLNKNSAIIAKLFKKSDEEIQI